MVITSMAFHIWNAKSENQVRNVSVEGTSVIGSRALLGKNGQNVSEQNKPKVKTGDHQVGTS